MFIRGGRACPWLRGKKWLYIIVLLAVVILLYWAVAKHKRNQLDEYGSVEIEACECL